MMKITREDLDRAINQVRENNDLGFQHYSGRSMYGKETWGVVAESPQVLTEFELELAIALSDTEEHVPGTGDDIDLFDLRSNFLEITDRRRQDYLGHDTIWYYPGIEVIDE